jgi:hypothetical protein
MESLTLCTVVQRDIPNLLTLEPEDAFWHLRLVRERCPAGVRGGSPLALEPFERDLLAWTAHEPRDVLGAVFFDAARRPLGTCVPFRATSAELCWDGAGLLAPALLCAASQLVAFRLSLAGFALAFDADLACAEQLALGAQALGLRLLDYWQIADGAARSLAALLELPPLDAPAASFLAALRAAQGRGPTPRPEVARLPVRYRNPERPTETWAGRGSRPRWLRLALAAGAELADFEVPTWGRRPKTR